MNVIHVRETRRAVMRIVAIYAILGALWIYLSDTALGRLVNDPHVMTTIATYKGLLFIALTSSLLYVLISRFVAHISEKNRQLKISEDRFQSIYHGISEAVFIHDAASGAIISVNRTACELFGYTNAEILAMDVGKLSQGDAPYSLKEALIWLHQTALGAQQKFEWFSRRKDGSVFWVEVRMRAEMIGDDRRIIVSVRDISDRKQSMEEFNAIIRTTTDGFFVSDLNSRLLEVNQSYCNMVGYSRDELLRMNISDLDTLELPEATAERRGRIVASGSDHFESQHRCKDGRVIDIDASVTYLSKNKTGGRFYSFIRDISERKMSQEKLRQSEEKFSAIFKTSPDSININRLADGVFLDVNEGFSNLSGYAAEEVIGKPSKTFDIWVDEADRKRLAQILKERGSIENLEAKLYRKDGTKIIALVSSRLVEIDGEACTLSIARDITEREYIQMELLKMQKLESLGVLAGGIAHDFNNIITGIVGNISFARMFLDPAHRSFNMLMEAEKASQRATDLAQQLLTFAKGGQPIKKAVSALQIVEASVSLALGGSNVLNIIQIPADLHAIEADEGQINQAFNNIFINAVQAMPDGGTITISMENVTLDGTNPLSLPGGEYVRISCTDTGCGMSDETRKRIFDPYFTTKPGGTGLGLASVYSIINRHGGNVSVRSGLGLGTTFDILLPASSLRASEAGTCAAPLIAGKPNGRSLLVMDDEEMLRELASVMLGEFGYEVRTCVDGAEAIAFYKAAREANTPFWAAIMDLTIPGGMGGKEAARQILDIDPHARLIVSSGYSNDPVMADYERYGFCGTVAKPYNMSEIVRILEGLLLSEPV